MKNLTLANIQALAFEFSLPVASIRAIIDVESGGKGFDALTGKIIIQFEPAWYKRKAPYTPTGLWSLNGVEKQSKEWIAFNDAFAKNQSAAMESTSIGMMQVMGFHWKLLGFKTVGQMWDYAKVSEINQVRLGLLFIKSNKKMFAALVKKDWATVAYYYNGAQYRRFNYDVRLANAYKKYES